MFWRMKLLELSEKLPSDLLNFPFLLLFPAWWGLGMGEMSASKFTFPAGRDIVTETPLKHTLLREKFHPYFC